MNHVNWGRLFVGGLVAAAVILAIEFTFHWWLRGADWWFFRALADPVQEARAILLYVGRYTLVGLTATTSSSSIMKAKRRQPSLGCAL